MIPTLQGAQGVAGKDGVDGQSAYELAVASGFSGTKTEWLASLKGDAGAAGPQGPQGPQGLQGEKGATGSGIESITTDYQLSDSTSIVPVNEWSKTIYAMTSTLPALWTRTTFLMADGTSNIAYSVSSMGPQGATGPQGPAGTKGDTGSVGPQGIQGPAGSFKFIDNRGEKLTPKQYNSTYPKQIIEELYNTTDLGITLLSGQSSWLTVVETIIPWNDSTGGYPIQRAFPTSSTRPLMYIRKGTGDTAWSAWELMTTW